MASKNKVIVNAELGKQELFITRETVATDTLAKRATSLMVLMLFSLLSLCNRAPLYPANPLKTGVKRISAVRMTIKTV